VANFGAVAFGAGAFVCVWAGLFAFFSCLTGSAAQVTAGLNAARLNANTPIATVILEPVAVYMTSSDFIAAVGTERTDVSSITGLEAG
jgi:hypothetical protein